MKRFMLAGVLLVATSIALAGQAPSGIGQSDIPMSHRDRVYAAEQFSNTVSVIDPVDNRLLGVLKLGDPAPGNLSPLYRGQLLVHGMGFSPDHKTLAVVSIGSNSVTFVDTGTNLVRHVAYVGRSPHEAFFTQDGREVWVTVRGENYVDVLDGATFAEKRRIEVPNGPGMTIFSPDGKYGYVCSSFTPETVVIATDTHEIVGHVTQPSPFCPDIAASPDGSQVWMTLKDVGDVMAFNARPPFNVLHTIKTGPITNHVNFVVTPKGTFAYVTVGGQNEVQVYRTDTYEKIATIPVGALPHGLWPSGDGTRIYVGLENGDGMVAIDTSRNEVVATVPIGQAPQAVAYVPDAVHEGTGLEHLQPLALAGQVVHLNLRAPGQKKGTGHAPEATTVSLFDQGLIQVIQAAVTGLEPKKAYVLALSTEPGGGGVLEPIASFTTNPTGAAIVDALGPIRQLVTEDAVPKRRYLTIAEAPPAHGAPVQVQSP